MIFVSQGNPNSFSDVDDQKKDEGEKYPKETWVIFPADAYVEKDTVVIELLRTSFTWLAVVTVHMHIFAADCAVDQQFLIPFFFHKVID